MGDAEEAAVLKIEQAILRHVQAHPNAADTVEGIARWWLEDFGPEPSRSAVQQALDRLEAAGQMIHTVLVDGTMLYGSAMRCDPPGRSA